jgi:hypothetical protein
MAYNELDKALINKYQQAGGRGAFLKKKVGNIANKVSNKVSNVVGGRDLVDYAGSKIAKMRASDDQKKYVEDKTSGKSALKSAGKVGLTVASITGAGKVASTGLKVLKKQGLKKAVSKPPGYKKEFVKANKLLRGELSPTGYKQPAKESLNHYKKTALKAAVKKWKK